MAVNKQPIFTGAPVIQSTTILYTALGSFNPANAYENAAEIFKATDSNGTLIDRITIHPIVKPNGGIEVITEKMMYLILAYDLDATPKSSILAVKKWDAFDMSSTFQTPPYWELTFTGGIVLRNNDSLRFNQIKGNGNPADGSGDGVTVIVEGSTYTQV